jgi:AbrB family looped-hinge helix DNA binding protein
MKSTGIIRRIDDLGRVAIPKEIRRQLRIREGDPLEIFVDRDGYILLKKYSPIGELGDFAKEYADSLYESTGHIALITDTDMVIAVSGVQKVKFLDKSVDHFGNIGDRIAIHDDNKIFQPIIADGDIVGAVILLVNEGYEGKFGDLEYKIAETAALFLAKQFEE